MGDTLATELDLPVSGMMCASREAVSHVEGALKELPGVSKVLSVADKPVIVVNTPAGGLRAFSAICTHLGCIVAWNQQKQVIQSPCHDGRFNPVTGAVVSGPPPRPLPAYEFEIVKDQVYVGRPLGSLYGSRG